MLNKRYINSGNSAFPAVLCLLCVVDVISYNNGIQLFYCFHLLYRAKIWTYGDTPILSLCEEAVERLT